MTEKGEFKRERAGALMKLAESSWKEFDTRRTYEWKVNFALWAALAALAGILLRGEAHLNLILAIILAVLILLINVVYILLWTRGMHARNKIDQTNAHFYWLLVEQELGIKDERHKAYKESAEKEPFWKNWSRGTQVTITMIITILAAASLVSSALRPLEPEKQTTCCCPPASQKTNP